MRFHFEKLGLIDQAEIELADLTLICGENTTGKTYAPYAIYGFLRSWRQLLRFALEKEVEACLTQESNYQIDLQEMFNGSINDYLQR